MVYLLVNEIKQECFDLSIRFTKLNTESFEVKEQVEKNQKSVEENDRMLKFG